MRKILRNPVDPVCFHYAPMIYQDSALTTSSATSP
jgi:hypothetical protein